MISGIYITYPAMFQVNQSGILKKVYAQIKAFSELGCDCKEVKLKPSSHNIPIEIIRKIQWLPFINVWPYWEYLSEFDSADFIYLRRPSAASSYMIETLKIIKKKNPLVKIILEIPTFPYDLELSGTKRLLLWKDRRYRNMLKSCVDYISLPSLDDDDKEIFGIPVINYHNGCDYSEISIRNYMNHGDTINILCVANFQPSHGYERLIKGLANYYLMNYETEVKLQMVGDGEECNKYKELTNKLGLKEKIVFHGFRSGKKLDDLYDIADIAVSALGTYKIKNAKVSCIKTGEYMAKGIPVIFAGDKEDVPEECRSFVHVISNDDKPVDINGILAFLKDLMSKEKMETLSNKIRENGQNYYDMKNVVKPIVKKICDLRCQTINS